LRSRPTSVYRRRQLGLTRLALFYPGMPVSPTLTRELPRTSSLWPPWNGTFDICSATLGLPRAPCALRWPVVRPALLPKEAVDDRSTCPWCR
jgi:hypothetical protein